MQSRSVIQCFILLIMMVTVAFIGEFMVMSLTGEQVPALYRIAPVTSIPLFFKERSAFRLASEKKEEAAKTFVTLRLLNGKEFRGELVSEDSGWITLKIDGNQVGFSRAEIAELKESNAAP